MAQKTADTDSRVAFDLFMHIQPHCASSPINKPEYREWALELFAECLDAVKGARTKTDEPAGFFSA